MHTWLIRIRRAIELGVWSSAFAGALLATSALILALAGASWRYSLPRPEISAPAIRVFAENRQIAVIHPMGGAQGWLSLDRMPRSVVDAVVTAEDRRFWMHPGVDVLAMGRALGTNLRHDEVREGASTITQQLARTLVLDTSRTWTRKLHEAFIALLLEARYSKPRILEAYINTVYLGHDGGGPVRGLPAASRHFLGKELGAAEVDEAAWLAGAIRAPNRMLSGASAEGRARRDGIIKAMREAGFIDHATARRALARPLDRRSTDAARLAPYFVDVVAQELGRRTELPPTGALDVHTTLSLSLQRAAEAAVRGGIARIEKHGPLAGKVQVAVVAIEPESGRIRALVGGRGYRDAPFNRATRAVRQPGSLFKPFVYLAAFEAEGRGLTPASILADEPVVIQAGNGSWAPRNIDGKFHGPVTVRRALEESSLALDGDRGGPVIAPLPPPARAVSAESAFVTTHLLRGVMRSGTGAGSAAWGLQEMTAGKTGTTDGLRDAWLVGYTPDLVVGVWVGLDDGSALGLTGAQAALPVWAAIMQAAVRQSPPRPFTPPPGVVLAQVDRRTGRPVSFWCGSDDVVQEAFREGMVPRDECGSTGKRTVMTFMDWVGGVFGRKPTP
jgi:membrane peptidoglycan carboxypeptidase